MSDTASVVWILRSQLEDFIELSQKKNRESKLNKKRIRIAST